MEINNDGLEELYRGLYKECIETIALLMCSAIDDTEKVNHVEALLLEYGIIK